MATKTIFFIFENRQKVKWDSKLPNHGMLIWHIDYDRIAWSKNALNDTVAHQRIDIVEAGKTKVNAENDGHFAQFLKDDPFPGSENVTEFGPLMSWSGKEVLAKMYDITEKDSIVCFSVNPEVPVNDDNCVYVEKLSSSQGTSSSSQAKSSSSVERKSSLSQAESSSSEQRTFTYQGVQKPAGIRIATEGRALLISSAVVGLKTVHVFDVQVRARRITNNP